MSLCACLLVKGLAEFEPTDEADADLFFGEHGYSFNHPIYWGIGILRKIEIFCGDELHDFLSYVFSPHILLGIQFHAFFVCLSRSISSLLCLIRRSTISLPSFVSCQSKSLSRSWSLFSITRGLIGRFPHRNNVYKCLLQGVAAISS